MYASHVFAERNQPNLAFDSFGAVSRRWQQKFEFVQSTPFQARGI
jgi:hypothetical protein